MSEPAADRPQPGAATGRPSTLSSAVWARGCTAGALDAAAMGAALECQRLRAAA